MKKAVIAIVPTRLDAENLVSELRSDGFGSNDISVLLPDQRGTRAFAHEVHTKAPEGATAGVGAGGVIGGTLGLLAGIGALAIPGLGPFIAAGPLLAGLSGIAAGGVVGGVVGALVGMGIPEYEAKIYEGKLRGGNVLVSVHTDDAEERAIALSVFNRAGVKDATTKIESKRLDAADDADDRPTIPMLR
jgi:hypothetical protein